MRLSLISHLNIALLLGSSVACAPQRQDPVPVPSPTGCNAPMTRYLRSSVYLDRSNTRDPLGPYSEAEWGTFIDEVLINHLPDGGTVFDNTGWWRRPNGTTFRGIGRTLVVLAPQKDSVSHRTGVRAVVDAIKQRYGHRLVIHEEALVCALF